jgi:hypothetical protein
MVRFVEAPASAKQAGVLHAARYRSIGEELTKLMACANERNAEIPYSESALPLHKCP